MRRKGNALHRHEWMERSKGGDSCFLNTVVSMNTLAYFAFSVCYANFYAKRLFVFFSHMTMTQSKIWFSIHSIQMLSVILCHIKRIYREFIFTSSAFLREIKKIIYGFTWICMNGDATATTYHIIDIQNYWFPVPHACR